MTSGSRWNFVVLSDMQPGSPRSFRYRPGWRENWQTAMRQAIDLKPDLALCPGDITRDGNVHRFEFEEMKRDLESLPFHTWCVAGNMDTGNKRAYSNGRKGEGQMSDLELNVTCEQLRQYSEFFGPLWWTFVHKNVRFTGITDVVIDSGLPQEEELWRWMDWLKTLPREQHHIFTMHYAVFMDRPDEGNYDITDPRAYGDWYFTVDEPSRSRLINIFKASAVTRVVTGHIHCRRHVQFDGICYDYAPGTAFPQFGDRWPDGDPTLGMLQYEVSGADMTCSFVPLDRVSENSEGYGLGGHPALHARDYSLAWVK